MKKIAVFHHSLFFIGDPPRRLPYAEGIVSVQMNALKESGLLAAASQIICGVNGGEESHAIAKAMLPQKAHLVFHGLECRNECRTIRIIEEWLPGHEDWFVLYHHSKGASRFDREARSANWLECMQRRCVWNWQRCIHDLESGYDAVGCHWFEPPYTPPGQRIFAGTFFWAKASYLMCIPSLMSRDRIKVSGIDSLESRYEAECWIGNGRPLPKVKDYHSGWDVDAKPHP